MSIKVIGAGFGRTGTLSMRAALEVLGFGPCYHMFELLERPEHAPQWRAAIQSGQADWNRLFDGYKGTVDWPGSTFYKELLQTYPDAKVVLTVRDSDKWYDSTLRTIYSLWKLRHQSQLLKFGRFFMPQRLRAGVQVIDELIWEQTFCGAFEDRRYAIEIYEQHNEEVKRNVPADQLLVYQPGDGWEPLCEFLGVEVPQDMPFPHLNDTETFNSQRRTRLMLVCLAPLAAVLLLMGLTAAGLKTVARRRGRREDATR
jgi:Sulfotransferase domain